MSGWSDSRDCPNCGGKESMMESGEDRPHMYVGGECLECGFCYYTKDDQMTLKDVNERRIDFELKPLKQLKKAIDRI